MDNKTGSGLQGWTCGGSMLQLGTWAGGPGGWGGPGGGAAGGRGAPGGAVRARLHKASGDPTKLHPPSFPSNLVLHFDMLLESSV